MHVNNGTSNNPAVHEAKSPTNIISIAEKLAAYDADPVPVPAEELAEQPVVIHMNQVVPKPVDWLWKDWLPKGMLTILGGYAGDGKSTLTLALATALSNSTPLPDGTVSPITDTLLMLAEDDVEHVVGERLLAHNANMHRIHVLAGKTGRDSTTTSINLKTDILQVRKAICDWNIGLLVIDPLSGFLANCDRNNEGDVRDSLAPLLVLAEETGVAVVGIMHIGKSDAYQRSMQRLLGSTAYTAVARAVWMVHPLPDDMQEDDQPRRNMLGIVKSNYAVPPTPMVYSRPYDGALEFHGAGSMTMEELIAYKKPREQEKGSEERDAAKQFLYKFLAGGMKSPVEIERAGHSEGHTKRILRRAKEDMNIQSIKVKDRWFWMLPTD